MSHPHGAHLVGSINLPDAETTFRLAAEKLGAHLHRIPDGEVGDRFHWIAFQPNLLAEAEGLERVGDTPFLVGGHLDQRPLRIREGVDATELRLPPLGYADAALESWQTFARLRDEGVIPHGTRFQVSLPTPTAIVGAYIVPQDRARFEPVYRAALFGELDRILADIPHDSLAIQWDTALEFGFIEGVAYDDRPQRESVWFDDVWAGVIERAVEQAAQVPEPVELGFHLCYGDIGEQHYIEPTDAGNLARFAQELVDRTPRPINWIHLPVPIDRDDDAYFAPLAQLRLPETTALYLGLVHRQDGVEGAHRRIEAASKVVPSSGIATECGFGRAPEEATLKLFDLHAALLRE